MGILRLDFETRSPVDIKSSGPWRYAEDPRTEILCMAYKLDDEYTKLIPYEDLVHGDVDFPELDYAIENCYVFEAHNAEFERAIWTHKLYHMLRSRHLCPSVDQWSCTAARAAALSLPRSLEGVAAALHLPIQKDMKGRALMLKMSKPRKPTKADPYSLYHSGKDDLNRLYQYCINDVNTEYEVSKHLPELQGEERQVWILDQQMNEHGVLVDIEAVERIKNSVEVYVDNLVSELPALTNGVVTSVGQVARIAEFCGLKSANAASVEDALKSDSMDPKAKKVLSIRQVCSKTSTKKYNRMMDQVCKDGRLKSNLRIYAAGTGRWGGRGVQLQNLPRGKYKDPYLIVDCFKKFDADFIDTLWGDAMGAASTAIRSTLIAPEDHTFLCADFAQIEARVLAWLAGEVDLLRIFRSGQDVYRDMASTIFSMPSADIGKDSFERFVGKTAVLGLGYQMGSDKFRQTCIDAGQDIPRELAQKTVDIYRKKYGRIKDFWKNTEKAAIAAVETGVPQQVGKVTFSSIGRNTDG